MGIKPLALVGVPWSLLFPQDICLKLSCSRVSPDTSASSFPHCSLFLLECLFVCPAATFICIAARGSRPWTWPKFKISLCFILDLVWLTVSIQLKWAMMVIRKLRLFRAALLLKVMLVSLNLQSWCWQEPSPCNQSRVCWLWNYKKKRGELKNHSWIFQLRILKLFLSVVQRLICLLWSLW